MYSGAMKMGFSGKLATVLWVAGDLGAIGTIAASLAGLLPPLAALIAIMFYIIQIKESDTISRALRNWRLRKLTRLRVQAVEYELFLQHKDKDLTGLVAANKIHIAAEMAASLSTEKQFEKDEAAKSTPARLPEV